MPSPVAPLLGALGMMMGRRGGRGGGGVSTLPKTTPAKAVSRTSPEVAQAGLDIFGQYGRRGRKTTKFVAPGTNEGALSGDVRKPSLLGY